MNRLSYLVAWGMLPTAVLGATEFVQQTFRAGTDAVVVEVLIEDSTDRGRLTASDFVLLDNGVRQQVDVVTKERLPVDWTLVIDLSTSVVLDIDRFWNDMRRAVMTLGADDTIRILGVGGPGDLREIVSASSPALPLPDPPDRFRGESSAIRDALVTVMAMRGSPARPRVTLMLTDGEDFVSATSNARLLQVAERVDSRTYILLTSSRRKRALEEPGGHPMVKASRAALAALARMTGGHVLESKELVTSVTQVRQALDRSHVLIYSPKGVSGNGWHAISVQVTRPGSAVVRSRRGYYAVQRPSG